jgi:hypothetical protein
LSVFTELPRRGLLGNLITIVRYGSPGPRVRCSRRREGLYGSVVNMNPRDFRKAARYLGVLLLAVVGFIVERFLL